MSFSPDVNLQLGGRGVSDADRAATVIPREPGKLGFRKASLPGDAVERLNLRRLASDCTQEPVSPRDRLLRVAGIYECVERERRISQPAEAVVPIARPSDALR